jgi:hypothetical protein
VVVRGIKTPAAGKQPRYDAFGECVAVCISPSFGMLNK